MRVNLGIVDARSDVAPVGQNGTLATIVFQIGRHVEIHPLGEGDECVGVVHVDVMLESHEGEGAI